jgi:hypothetical protein
MDVLSTTAAGMAARPEPPMPSSMRPVRSSPTAVRDEVWITDTLFPRFFWLLGREPLDCIERYGKELARLVLPLRPLIVYIDADAPVFDRAIAVRGDEWGVRIIEFIKTWKLPSIHALRTAMTCSGSKMGEQPRPHAPAELAG